MPITTSLNNSPYFDDYNINKDYYRMLFKPGVSVQVRELNQLQAMMAKQIEWFGDSIFQSGTIVSGCTFNFMSNYRYAKILDNDVNGVPVDPPLYVGKFVTSSTGMRAYVINSANGFQSSSPNLNTIYVNYLNSGQSGTQQTFNLSDVLTITDANNSIFSVIVNTGGIGFSNTNQVVFSPAILVQMLTGVFSVGQNMVQPSSGANVVITQVDSSTFASQNLVAIYYSPRSTDLANGQVNSSAWTITANNDVTNVSNTISALVQSIVGSGASAFIITNAAGRITQAPMTSQGTGYTLLPVVSVWSPNNATGISTVNLTAQNYLTKITVAATSDAIGSGYAFGVSDGVIYQKGYFERVAQQVAIISAYSNTPNAIAVGFSTVESIIDSNIDTSLLDNAIGTPDQNAPGADRLQLTPTLTVLNTATAQTTLGFLTLVEWNEGTPYKQNQVTQYSVIGQEMARRTYDSSGDFVLDPFLVTSASPSNTAAEGQYYAAIIDSGEGYISGQRVQTNFNFQISVPKGLDTAIVNNLSVSLNYDAYLRCANVGGIFQFNTGDTVQLYDTAAGWTSNVQGVIVGTISAVGNNIGTARIRSMILEAGRQGDPTAIYRLYLFQIAMNQGANFKNVKSVFYNGTNKGIGDVILQLDSTTLANISVLQSVENNQLVFPTGLESLKNSNAANYIYRTIDQTTAFGNNGILTKSIAANPNEFYPYSGYLSNSQMNDLYVVPIANNLVGFTNLSGTISSNTTSPNIIGTTTTFLTDLVAGDYVYMFPNNTIFDIKKVIQVVNNTLFIADSNCAYTNSSSNYVRTFPKNLPIPFGSRAGLTANVNSNGNILTLYLGFTITGTTSVNTAVGVNIEREGIVSTAKTVNRNQFVLMNLSNNVANTVGPWCIGVPDVFRLRNVYIGNSSVTPNTGIDITSEFYIDSKQNSNYYDLSFLYLKPTSPIALATNNCLLVCFDYYTGTSGYYDTVSYLQTANAQQIASIDSLPLANLTTAAATWEVPEIYTYDGAYYNLLNCIDFRPYVVNTVTTTTNGAAAPVNPTYTVSFGNTANSANDKKFPLPDSLWTGVVEQYLGRTDTIVLGSDQNVVVLRGISQADPAKRTATPTPNHTILLQTIAVAPYPNMPLNPSVQLAQVVSTGVYNQRKLNTRMNNHLLSTSVNMSNIKYVQPQGYDMAQIGKLDRRISQLEYYQSLSLLETNISQLVIPSSVDPSIDRFLYGFFVDDFSTTLYSDKGDPEYAASVEAASVPISQPSNTVLLGNVVPTTNSFLLVPPKFEWILKHISADLNPTYVDFIVINQNYATTPNAAANTANTANTANGAANVAQGNGFFYQFYSTGPTYNTLFRKVANVQMSSFFEGNCILYFDLQVLDPDILVYQYQNNFPILVASTATAQPLTGAQAAALLADPYTQDFFPNFYYYTYYTGDGGEVASYTGNISRAIGFPSLSSQGGLGVMGGGYISWVHNPALGTKYQIVFQIPANQPGFPLDWYVLEYPIDVTVSAGQFIPPIIDGTSSVYWGTMNYQTIGSYAQSYGSFGFDQYGNPNYGLAASPPANTTQVFDRVTMFCTGLKPNTQHSFYINGTLNANVQMDGALLGANLVSDSHGTLVATYFLDNVWKNLVANAKVPAFSEQTAYDWKYGWQPRANSASWDADSSASFSPATAVLELVGTDSVCYAEVPIIPPSQIIF